MPAMGKEIAWHTTDLPAVKQKAAAEKKPIAIDFFATWCGPCKAMDRTTYLDPEVAKMASKMLMLRLDAESTEGAPIAKDFGVGSYPTLVFLAADGSEIDRFTGYKTAKEFVPYLSAAIDGKSIFAANVARLAAHPEDLDLLAEVADGYVLRLDDANALAHLERLEAADPDNARGHLERAYESRADLYRRKRDFAKAGETLHALLSKVPALDKSDEKQLRTEEGKYFVKAGDADRAVAAYKVLIEKFPTKESYNAMAWELSQKKLALDEAEAAAKKAVELSKEDPEILDTLAEVYFAQGRLDEAIALGKKEVGKDPKNDYYARQLKKYEDAKAGKAGS